MTTGYITLTDVSLSGPMGTGSFDPTTLTIDYTNLSATGSVIWNFPNASTATFTNFDLRYHADAPGEGTYHLSATDAAGATLHLAWSGQTPAGFNVETRVSEKGERHFNHFVVNSITPGACFAAGTLIRRPPGDVPVETLKAGDLVLTASGDMRPVKWMGHTDVDFRRTPKASPGLPIRIAADAFGPARPSHDLYLSPGHSVCVDLLGEVLIPVGYLVNGGTIAEVETDEISYWHVELHSHDILIANNLPAESYLAMGNRGAFEEVRGLLPAVLEGRDRTHADFCRPVMTEGPVLDVVRQRLTTRAEELGWRRERNADLHLVADGDVLRPRVEDGAAAFVFPASAKDVRLMSHTFSPAAVGSKDPRILGVMLAGLAFSSSCGCEPRRISLDDDRLHDGVYPVEDHGGGLRRWTNGSLVLDPQLWEGLSGQVVLLVTYDHATVRDWAAPPALATKVDAVDTPKLFAIR